MRRLARGVLRMLAVLVVLALVLFGVRFVNGLRHPTPDEFAGDPTDATRYPLTQPGLTVTPVQGDYLAGFHLKPEALTRAGLVVVWGGSEGGPDYDRGVRLARQGYEVLSLFFWGQSNQRPTLADVPLDFFDEVLAWRDDHVATGPLTVIGTSKGAELALALAGRYPQVDHVVLYAPTRHSWQGLDYSAERPTWTWRGEPVPYVSFRYASPGSVAAFFGAMLLNLPAPLKAEYDSAEAGDPNAGAARLPVPSQVQLLAFAGADDAMFTSARDAVVLAEEAGSRGEAHVYPGAGHLFGSHDGWLGGFAMGGDRAGNEAAQQASDEVLDATLARWHPAR